jgi:hypothetical protein
MTPNPTSHISDLVHNLHDPKVLIEAICAFVCHAEEPLAQSPFAIFPLVEARPIADVVRDWLEGRIAFEVALGKARAHNHTIRPSAVRSPRRQVFHYCSGCQLAQMLEVVRQSGDLPRHLICVAACIRRSTTYAQSSASGKAETEWQVAYLESLLASGGHSPNHLRPSTASVK